MFNVFIIADLVRLAMVDQPGMALDQLLDREVILRSEHGAAHTGNPRSGVPAGW